MELVDGEVLSAIVVIVCVGVTERSEDGDGEIVGLDEEKEVDPEVGLDVEALELKKRGLRS